LRFPAIWCDYLIAAISYRTMPPHGKNCKDKGIHPLERFTPRLSQKPLLFYARLSQKIIVRRQRGVNYNKLRFLR
jgi:hypothetical protein